MDDLAERYAPMIEQIANAYRDDEAEYAQLRSLRVTREVWDDNLRGGHFYFEVPAPAADHDFVIEVQANDADGSKIAIILHSVGGLLNWGEWFRYRSTPTDSQPVLRWPPTTVTRSP